MCLSNFHPALCLSSTFLLVDISDVIKYCSKSVYQRIAQAIKNESPRHWSKLSRLGPGDLSFGHRLCIQCEICIVLRSLKTLISQVGYGMVLAILSTTAGLLKILKSVRFASFEHHTTTFKLHDIGTYRNEKGFHIGRTF